VTIPFLALFNKNPRIRPPTIPIDNQKLVWQIRMWLNQKRFEDSFVRHYLSLQFVILFWSKAWLLRVRDEIIQIHRRPISSQDRSVKSTFLEFAGLRVCFRWHLSDHR
jgi:hypothetical protein